MRRAPLLIIVLLAWSSAFATIGKVQQATCQSSGASSVVCTLPNDVTAGNTMAVCVSSRTAGITESVLTNGSGIVQTGSSYGSAPLRKQFNNPELVETWYARDISGGGGSKTVTINFSASRARAVVVAEFSGMSALAADTDGISVPGSGNVMNNGNLDGALIDQPYNLLVGCFGQDSTVTPTSPTNGWSIATGVTGGNTHTTMAWKANFDTNVPQAAIGTSLSSSSTNVWIGQISILKASGSPSIQFPLTVTQSGSGGGTVTSSPGGINCVNGAGACSANYDSGTAVTLTAVADGTSTFAGWSGDPTCPSVTVTGPIGCTATFTHTASTYHVRTDGNDATCTGLTNAAASAAPNCAFLSFSKGLSVLHRGDLLHIVAGTHTTRTTSTQCTVGNPAVTQMGKLLNQGSGAEIIIYGDLDPNLPALDPNAHLSIFDGGGTTQSLMSVCGSNTVTVKDLKWQNFIGDATHLVNQYAPVDLVGTGIKWINNVHLNPSLDGKEGNYGEINIQGSGFLIKDNYLSGSFPILINMINGTFLDTLGGTITHNHVERVRHLHTDGTSPTQLVGIATRSSGSWIISDNYVVDNATDAYTQEAEGMWLRDSEQWQLHGNVIKNIKGTQGQTAYVYLQDGANPPKCPGGGNCNERAQILNNTLVRTITSGDSPELFMFRLSCSGCTVRGNAIDADSAAGTTIRGYALANTAGGDFGTPTTIDYSFFNQIDTPLDGTTFSGYICPTAANPTANCTLHSSLDDLVSLHDRKDATGPHFNGTGVEPDPLYRPVPPSILIDTGDDANCGNTIFGAHCDIGAFEVAATSSATCTDTIKNGNETDVDCGGGTCPDCADTKVCLVAGDCLSNRCDSGFCRSCSDGVKTGAETAVDCGGGICNGCANGSACVLNRDCASNICTALVCIAAGGNCTNTVKDGAETDVDCGGGTCPPCAVTKTCATNSDCASNRCDSLVCRSCTDSLKTGAETDVDCGGGICPACVNTKTCLVASDCQSNNCTNGICVTTPTCVDGVKNGSETDIDCGGSCQQCATGKTCSINADCVNARCDSGVCRSCDDGLKTGAETDIDCGGGNCSTCVDGKACVVGTSCASGRCDSLFCRSCTDGLKTGAETAVDCGGGICPTCATGQSCSAGSDCASGRCETSVCRSCTDRIKSGSETDIDCGGPCADCANGQRCAANGDCVSNSCVGGICTAVSVPTGTSPFIIEWNVRPDGSDTGCTGAANKKFTADAHRSCAFQTLQRAANAARCGDTITIRSGTHTTGAASKTVGCESCSGGIYTYTTMMVLQNKTCTRNAPITVRGELDNTGSTTTIVDGQNTVRQALLVDSSSYINIRDIEWRNFLGTSDSTEDFLFGIVGLVTSDHINYIHNRNVDPNASSVSGGTSRGQILSTSTNTLIDKSYFNTSAPVIMTFFGPDATTTSNLSLRNSTILRSGVPSGIAAAAHIVMTNLKAFAIRNCYLGATPELSVASGSGIFGINTTGGTIQGNVINGLPGTTFVGIGDTSFPAGCGGGACTPAHNISNNSIYKAATSTDFTAISLGVSASDQVHNNLIAVKAAFANSNDKGLVLGAAASAASADYNMFSNVAKPMTVQATGWGCPVTACASHLTLDELTATHDQHNTADPGFTLAGFAPTPYFALKVGATGRNTGTNSFCFVDAADGTCDIGAFEMGGSASSPNLAPPVTVN